MEDGPRDLDGSTGNRRPDWNQQSLQLKLAKQSLSLTKKDETFWTAATLNEGERLLKMHFNKATEEVWKKQKITPPFGDWKESSYGRMCWSQNDDGETVNDLEAFDFALIQLAQRRVEAASMQRADQISRASYALEKSAIPMWTLISDGQSKTQKTHSDGAVVIR